MLPSTPRAPVPPHLSGQLPDVYALLPRIGNACHWGSPPSKHGFAGFYEIRAIFFRNDVPPPSLNRALVVDAYEFPRPSRPFFLYFITVHQDGGDSVSLFCIIAFGRCLARHCSYCTNRSEYVANTLWV